MRPKVFLLAAFLTIGASLCFASPPANATAAETKAKCYATDIAPAVMIGNADFAYIYLTPSGVEDAATLDVAILTNTTPTVEVKAKATVGAYKPYSQRVWPKSFMKFSNRNLALNARIVHIDPGLRGC